jgi:hypothetical protein
MSVLQLSALVSFSALDVDLIDDFLVQIPAHSLSLAMMGSKFWLSMARSTITSNCELLVTQATNSKRTLTARSSSLWCVEYALLMTPMNTFYQYRKYDKDLCPLLDGIFSFVLLDESLDPPRVIAARDPIGVTTLYRGWSSSRPETVFFSSELKCLVDECDKIIAFPPGHVFDSHDGSLTRYHTPSWWDGDSDNPDAPISSQAADLKSIRETLEASVRRRLMSEVPYGVLLSGGLDSSVIAAVAARETEKVAQAQFEARQRRLAQGDSGFETPPNSGVTEEGEANWFSFPFYLSLKPVRVFFFGGEQRLLPLGRGCTHFRSAWNIPLTSSLHGKQLVIWALCTMNTYSPFRKAWTPFQT